MIEELERKVNELKSEVYDLKIKLKEARERKENLEALVLHYQKILIEEGLYDIKRSKHKTKTTRK